MSSPRPRSHRPGAAALAAAVALALGLWGGCLAPTLPLPPPEEPEFVQMVGEGQWEIRGLCSAGALVTALVERTGTGAVVEDRDADGRYRVVVTADRCEVVQVWQTDGDEQSASTRVVLQAVANGTVLDPEACFR